MEHRGSIFIAGQTSFLGQHLEVMEAGEKTFHNDSVNQCYISEKNRLSPLCI